MPGPLIERGERVTLRTVEREDLPFFQRSFTNPAIRYPLGNQQPKNQSELEDWFERVIEDDSHDHFLVCLDDEEAGPDDPGDDETTPIGAVGAMGVDFKRPDLAYWFAPEYHGEGYGKEAVSLVVETIFRTYDTPGIGAGAYDFNEASRALLESLGFSEEGRRRKSRFVDGEYRDSVVYGLLREEWRE